MKGFGMDRAWTTRLLEAAERKDAEQEKEFLDLVNQADGKITLEVAKALMRTFSDKPDYGTQERVISVLASADNDKDVTIALLEELPRLIEDGFEWAETLVGEEIEYRPDLLVEMASDMSDEIKKILQAILGRPGFQSFYPAARHLVKFYEIC
jgi:hypothetical protein